MTNPNNNLGQKHLKPYKKKKKGKREIKGLLLNGKCHNNRILKNGNNKELHMKGKTLSLQKNI